MVDSAIFPKLALVLYQNSDDIEEMEGMQVKSNASTW
jgi:hypothetical protein